MTIHAYHGSDQAELAAIPEQEILLELRRSGLLLFRRFSIQPAEFEDFTNRLCFRFHYPAARASMREDSGDGFSAHVPEFNFVLLTHSEGVYIPHPNPPHRAPDIACFFCLVAPSESGGQTILVDGVEFAKRLPGQLLRRFEQQGVIYEALWEEVRWQNEFRVKTQSEALNHLEQIENIEYRFNGPDLHFRHRTAAITSTLTGQSAFATGILAHLPRFEHPRYSEKLVYTNPTNRVFFGDGEELGDEVINGLVDIQDDIGYEHDWQAGDMVLIDNTRFMHGRNMTQKDCERRILSRFGWLPRKAGES